MQRAAVSRKVAIILPCQFHVSDAAPSLAERECQIQSCQVLPHPVCLRGQLIAPLPS